MCLQTMAAKKRSTALTAFARPSLNDEDLVRGIIPACQYEQHDAKKINLWFH